MEVAYWVKHEDVIPEKKESRRERKWGNERRRRKEWMKEEWKEGGERKEWRREGGLKEEGRRKGRDCELGNTSSMLWMLHKPCWISPWARCWLNRLVSRDGKHCKNNPSFLLMTYMRTSRWQRQGVQYHGGNVAKYHGGRGKVHKTTKAKLKK